MDLSQALNIGTFLLMPLTATTGHEADNENSGNQGDFRALYAGRGLLYTCSLDSKANNNLNTQYDLESLWYLRLHVVLLRVLLSQ